jgi:cysteine/glycine-rich protein
MATTAKARFANVGAPKCPVCSKSVYAAEQVLAIGNSYHKACFKCSDCRKWLDSTSANDHDGTLFCKNCYGKAHGPKGFGFAAGGAGLSMGQQPQQTADDAPNFSTAAALEGLSVAGAAAPPPAAAPAPALTPATSSGPPPVAMDRACSSATAQYLGLGASSAAAPPAEPAPKKAVAPSKFGGAPQCPICSKSVYHAEQVLAAGTAYHKACFK